ncbi:MAG TPA: cell division FtsA domain-containing protein, partial [Chloroflexota bacterium]
LGVLLMDVGAGTTDLAWLSEDDVQLVSGLPFGGNHLTNDLSMVLGVPFVAAEELKVGFASAQPSSFSEDDSVDAGSFSDGEEKLVSRRLMSEVVEARVAEIFDLAMDQLKEGGFDGVLPAGAVLTGAGAQMRGLRDAAQEFLQVPVRLGQPDGLDEPLDSMVSPAYSTGVGILKWVVSQPGDLVAGRSMKRGSSGVFGRLKAMIRAFIP